MADEKKDGEDRKPRHYIGIGASAGGLEALQKFFGNLLPEKNGLAFIVVQHLSPDYKSLMKELLSKHTSMNVERVQDGIYIERDTVYLIPPKKNMVMRNGHLYLHDQPRRHSLNLPIDIFFASMAEDQQEKTVGIILSGTGSDGTRGVRAIKEQGGTVFVQDNVTAQFDGMPKSAMATGLVDFELSPVVMAEELLRFTNHPLVAGAPPSSMAVPEQKQDDFTKLILMLKKSTSVDFISYKPATVVRRIKRRMGIVGVHSLSEYVAFLQDHPGEVTSLFKDLLIGVTKFFRDRDFFNSFQRNIVPEIFQLAAEQKRTDIRVWIAGCSTGEEAYSVSLLLQNYMDEHDLNLNVKVFATDLDKDALEVGSLGQYPENIILDVDPNLLNRYFEQRIDGYRVKTRIRQMVVFARQDIVKDPPFTKMDLICCRNLLIYLQPSMQKRVLSIFNYSLIPDGFLFLGSSESLGELADHFSAVDAKSRLYKHIGQGALPLKEELFVPLGSDIAIPSTSLRLPSFAAKPHKDAGVISRERFYQDIIKKLVSILLIINEDRELVESYGQNRHLISLPEGAVSLDIASMMPRELALAVSSGIHRTRKEKAPCSYEEIRIKSGDELLTVNMTIDLLKNANRTLFLIQITEAKTPVALTSREGQAVTTNDKNLDRHIYDLEQEIQFTRENLQATIEELQTSNEELQATNEELLAANEELQSTNEELQSVNEELNTVNSEYQDKNIELENLNTDMRHLMEATEIGTLFLDSDMCIRRFTPAMSRVISILDKDVGRPIKDLDIQALGDLLADAAEVIENGIAKSREIMVKKEHYQLQILPFHNSRREIDGVVVTLVDITNLKQAESALEKQSNLFLKVLESSPAAQVMVDLVGNFTYANKMALEILNVTEQKLLSIRLDSMALGLTDMQGEPILNDKGFLEQVKIGELVDCFIVRQEIKKTGMIRVFNVSAKPSYDVSGIIDGAVCQFSELAYSNDPISE